MNTSTKQSFGKSLLKALSFILPIFTIIMLPYFIFLALGSQDKHSYLSFVSLGIFIFFFLIVVGLIIYQSVTNTDISKTKLWKKLFHKS